MSTALIFTFSTATMLLLSATAVVMGLFVVEPAYHFYRRWGKADQAESYELEKEFYLASTIIVIILAIRLFSIPLYFWTMQDLVPMIPGAMCLWGVFNVQPTLCWASLIIKLVLPALYLGWIIIYDVNNACKKNPLMRSLMMLFLLLLPLLMLDSVVDLSIFLNLNPVRVVCCSNAIDVWPRAIPSMIGGVGGQYLLLLLFYCVGVTLVVVAYYSVRFRYLSYVARLLTPVMSIVTVIAIIELFTPFILHTPFHFCPFCLFFKSPVSILFVVFTWIAVSSPWWSFLVDFISRSDNDAKHISFMISKKMWLLSSYSMIMSLSVITLLFIFSMMI